MSIDPQWQTYDWYIGPKTPFSFKEPEPYNLFGLKGRSIDDLQAAWEGGPEADPMRGQSLTGLLDKLSHLGQPAQPSSTQPSSVPPGAITVRLHVRGQAGANWGEWGTPPLHLTRERHSAPQWVEDLPGRGVVYVTLLGLSPQEGAALLRAVSLATMSSY